MFSALHPIADIARTGGHVGFLPINGSRAVLLDHLIGAR
jgi:hypothetical protein